MTDNDACVRAGSRLLPPVVLIAALSLPPGCGDVGEDVPESSDSVAAGDGHDADTASDDTGRSTEPPVDTDPPIDPDATGETDGPVDLGICRRYIECVQQLDTVPLSPIVALYGSSGACWAEFTVDVCWHDCRAGLNVVGDANPDVASCTECDSDVDCTDLGAEIGCYRGDCRSMLEGKGDVGDPCYSDHDCNEGFSCVDENSEDFGTCVDGCGDGGNDDCDVPGWVCDVDTYICRPANCTDITTCEECLAQGCVSSFLEAGEYDSCDELPEVFPIGCQEP
jgi:hypothetical protein